MKIHPLIGIQAIRTGNAIAWRFWTVVKFLDKSGGGWVEIDQVRSYLKSLGIRKQYIDRWERKAVLSEIVSIDKKGERYFYKGIANTAIILQAPKVMTPVILDDPSKLFNRQWHCIVWACFIESLERDKPISRQALRDITGVAERTQYKYEQQSGMIDVRRCWADRGKYTGQQILDKRYFVSSNNKIMERLPNLYAPKIGNGLRKGKKGSTRNTNRKLKSSLIVQRGKLYCSGAKTAHAENTKHQEDTFYLKSVAGINTYNAVVYDY